MIRLTTPIQQRQLETLKAGDKVLLSGIIYSARDQAHIRLKDETEPAFEMDGAVLYYVGPTPTKPGFAIGSSGPTSSYRMDNLSLPLMAKGIKVMIGKGDRSESFRQALLDKRCVYLIATGGIGALLASKIKSSRIIMYEELGAEAVHELIVDDFPCFVAYDMHGGNIFKDGK